MVKSYESNHGIPSFDAFRIQNWILLTKLVNNHIRIFVIHQLYLIHFHLKINFIFLNSSSIHFYKLNNFNIPRKTKSHFLLQYIPLWTLCYNWTNKSTRLGKEIITNLKSLNKHSMYGNNITKKKRTSSSTIRGVN